MARSKVLFGLLALAGVLVVLPAEAQFGAIFGERPPRPPGDIPNAPPAQRQPPYYPNDRAAPPMTIDRDEPPDEPLPAPMNLPPQSRPGRGTIQSQPLNAPPGTESRREAPMQPLPPAEPNPAQPDEVQPGTVPTLPGLPPGQRQPRQPAPPGNADVQPGDQIVVEPPPQRIANPTAVFAGLDKITGRIISFDVAINETVQFGALQVTPRVCYSRPPTESPQTDSFVEVDEVTLQGEIKRIFTGWMFAASPGLHAVEHPIYDVWLTDCKGGKNPAVAEAPPEEAKQPTAKQPAQRQPPARRAPAPQLRGNLPPPAR